MSVISIIISILIIGLLILIHEFGHFVLARKNGVFVKEFSLGFGPRILSKTGKSGTKFSWKAIPFGGSCIMLGAMEDEEEGLNDDERSFDKKSVWARMSIVLAGPVFNFFLAFVIAVIVIGIAGYDPSLVTASEPGSAVYEAGIREGDLITKYNGETINFGREIYMEDYIHPIDETTESIEITYKRNGEKHTVTVVPKKRDHYLMGINYYATADPAEITAVMEGGAVEEAGLEAGDVVLAVDGTEIETGEELAAYFANHPLTGEPIEITISRHGGDAEILTVTPHLATSYEIGLSYNLSNVKTDALGTLRYSLAEVKYQIVSVFKSIGFLFSGRGSLDMLSGPVGIVEIVDETYDAVAPSGFLSVLISMLSIVILLSANLGVVNLLPIPALDGGKFLLLIIEAIRRKPLNKKYEGVITMAGAVLIILLAIVVLVNDVLKFF